MKLVIDIPEEEYENVKKAGGCYYDFGKAIANGVPHETVTEFADRCRECGREKVLDKIGAEIKEQIDYHDNEHRKYDSEEEFGISLGLELALTMINKHRTESEERMR